MSTDRSTAPSHSLLVNDRATNASLCPIVGIVEASGSIVHYTAIEIEFFTTQSCNYYRALLPSPSSDPLIPSTTGVLALNSISYISTFFALQRLGHTPVLISSRLAPSAILHLLETTNCTAIIIENATRNLIGTLPLRIPVLDLHVTTVLALGAPVHPVVLDQDAETRNLSRPAWIFHSSASTGLPKAVTNPHSSSLVPCKVPASKTPGIGLATLPLFHSFGMDCLIYALQTGIETIFYSGDIPLTGERVISVIEQAQVKVLYMVPYNLRMISEAAGGIAILKSMEAVIVGGGPLPEPLGDQLVQEGVTLVNGYGCTELGAIMVTNTVNPQLWQWLEIMPHYTGGDKVFFEYRENGMWELCVGPEVRFSTEEEKRDPKDRVWRMGDLFLRHQVYEGLWKNFGRADDLMIMENGENWNPVGVEMAVTGVRGVDEAVGFGAGRNIVGLFVFSGAPDNAGKTLDEVWEAVKTVNKSTSAYARIRKDAIIWRTREDLARVRKTMKGNIIRHEFYQEFEQEITQFYESLERTRVRQDRPAVDLDTMEKLVKEHILRVVSHQNFDFDDLRSDVDLFSLGVDSQKATFVRLGLMKDLDFGESGIGRNAIYEYPTVRKLSAHLHALLDSRSVIKTAPSSNQNIASTKESSIDEINALIRSFSIPRAHEGDHILFTGGTGHFGSYLLYHLLSLPTITHITCLVRAPSQEAALARILASHAFVVTHSRYESKLIALPITTLSDANLGLADPQVYSKLATNITTIIHAAWTVNFLLPVSSFSPDLLALRNLLSFSLKSTVPPRFYFISSIGVGFSPGATNMPEGPISFPTITPQNLPTFGYGQSKFAAEHIILHTTAVNPRLRVGILRLGQVIGSDKGDWNYKEAWPAILSTAITIGCLPREVGGGVGRCWVTAEVAARSVGEILEHGIAEGSVEVWNLVGRKEVRWDIVLAAVEGVVDGNLAVVDGKECLRRLRDAVDRGCEVGPAGKLLGRYEKRYEALDDRPQVIADTEKTYRASQSLREMADVDQARIRTCLDYWMSGPWKDLKRVQLEE